MEILTLLNSLTRLAGLCLISLGKQVPLEEQAAIRERLSPSETSSSCFCCSETLMPGQFIFSNPMDAVMVLQGNVVMGKY